MGVKFLLKIALSMDLMNKWLEHFPVHFAMRQNTAPPPPQILNLDVRLSLHVCIACVCSMQYSKQFYS